MQHGHATCPDLGPLLPACCRVQRTRRPEPMWPVDRLSQRFSVAPVSSQRQSLGLALILRPVSSCSMVSAYLDTRRSSSHAATVSCAVTLSCACLESWWVGVWWWWGGRHRGRGGHGRVAPPVSREEASCLRPPCLPSTALLPFATSPLHKQAIKQAGNSICIRKRNRHHMLYAATRPHAAAHCCSR